MFGKPPAVIVRRSQEFRAVTLARILTGWQPSWLAGSRTAHDLSPPPRTQVAAQLTVVACSNSIPRDLGRFRLKSGHT